MLEFVLEKWIDLLDMRLNEFRVDDEISSSNYWQTRSIPSLFLSLLCYLRYSWILRGTSFNFTSKFSKLSIELWPVVAKLISIQWSLYSSRRIRCLDFIDPTLKSMSPYYCTRGSRASFFILFPRIEVIWKPFFKPFTSIYKTSNISNVISSKFD